MRIELFPFSHMKLLGSVLASSADQMIAYWLESRLVRHVHRAVGKLIAKLLD